MIEQQDIHKSSIILKCGCFKELGSHEVEVILYTFLYVWKYFDIKQFICEKDLTLTY